MHNKIVIMATRGELGIMRTAILNYRFDGDAIKDRHLLMEGALLYRLMVKLTRKIDSLPFSEKQRKTSVPIEQAIVFWKHFNNGGYYDPYTHVVVQGICDQIDKQLP